MTHRLVPRIVGTRNGHGERVPDPDAGNSPFSAATGPLRISTATKIIGQLDGFPLSVDRCGKAVELGFRPLGAALPVPEHEFNPPNPNP